RLVYYQASDGSPAIEVIDFKTDAISLEGMPARVAEYTPQIESYIRAVAAFAGLPETRVNAALLFTALGCIEPIRCSET
ncbi:MAG TPA: hypothetical protein VLM40_23030, partial [Gemmata sp.]|nr:hypothetical protein [Gemmata sp.]